MLFGENFLKNAKANLYPIFVKIPFKGRKSNYYIEKNNKIKLQYKYLTVKQQYMYDSIG